MARLCMLVVALGCTMPRLAQADDAHASQSGPDLFVPKVVAISGFGLGAIGIGIVVHSKLGAISDYEQGDTGAMSVDGKLLGSDDCGHVEPAPGDPRADAYDRACSAYTRSTIGSVMTLVGVSVGIGALVYILVKRDDKPAAVQVTPTAGSDGAGAQLQFRW